MRSAVCRFAVLFHTLRHMRLSQIGWQVRYRIQQVLGRRVRASSVAAPPPRVKQPLRAPVSKQSILSAGPTFTLLGHSVRPHGDIDWQAGSQDALWRYNLHYFDYLDELAATNLAGDATEFLHGWIRDNPPGAGEGWHAYPTSLRLVNWIRWLWQTGIADPVILNSLAVQADWLSQHLERHVLANHFFTNGKALLCAGLMFETRGHDAAQGWLDLGMRIVREQLDEQILDDGAHYELSAMYHGIVLDDVLDLIDMGEASGAIEQVVLSRWRKTAATMLDWSTVMSHPDGNIPFFNDSMLGIVAPAQTHRQRAQRLDLLPEHAGINETPSRHLMPSGYVRLATARAVVLADVAAVGPDYQPGHAHADTLSFECSLDGRRLLVNSGTSTYEPGLERTWVRSTAAHNTVEVDGHDSSEVWASFRIGRRARPLNVVAQPAAGRLSAAHDGYHRLPGCVTHRRHWLLQEDGLCVEDCLEGDWSVATIRYYLHPDFAVQWPLSEQVPDGEPQAGSILLAGCEVARFRVTGGLVRVTDALWYPRFGERLSNRCIVIGCRADRVRFELEFLAAPAAHDAALS